MNWTFGRKLAAGFLIAGLALVVVGVSGYQNAGRLVEHSRMVAHTHAVRAEVAATLAALTEAESAQRELVITGAEGVDGRFSAVHAEINRAVAHVRALTADNPRQQARIQRLTPLIQARIGHLQQLARTRLSEGFEAAQKVVQSAAGRDVMEQIRSVLVEMDQEELALLSQRTTIAEGSSAETRATILWGAVLAVVLVAVVGTLIARALTTQVSSAVQHIRSSSSELQSAASQQATSAKEQATAMSEVTTTLSELLATSRQIAESARRVSEIAEQTGQASRVGDLTVAKGRESMVGIRRQVELIVNHMLELGKKSQQIGAVLEIVSELAEQTNILAINATIEAAGAGDAGRRFGVVADEIRKLADRVGGSTKEIRALIDDVRSAVNTTVMTTETGSKAVEAGTEQFAEIAASFSRITSQIATATEAAKEIGLSTKQQSTAVEQVTIAFTNVSQAAKETEVSTAQTLRTASELSHLSVDLLRLVQPGIDAGTARGTSG
jgi:methyl-accepting chemotaxis protein